MDATSGYNSESDKSEKLEEALDENGPFDKEEGEIPNDEPIEEHEFDKNTQWADADVNQVPNQENFSTEFPTSPVAKNEKEESSSFSKPPGFELYFSNINCFPLGGNRRSPKQPSHFSSAPVKSSRVSKSQTKSFGNHGSMIEAFVSHIEMGKVLGYNMEGIWIASQTQCFMINVYAPQDDSKKEKLWNDILDFMNMNRGHHLIFGDFNVILDGPLMVNEVIQWLCISWGSMKHGSNGSQVVSILLEARISYRMAVILVYATSFVGLRQGDPLISLTLHYSYGRAPRCYGRRDGCWSLQRLQN
ncbi:RNA-directed DNA polymerase, eukaryota [Tanacetum coccineum]